MAVAPKRLAALAWHAVAMSSCLYGFSSLDFLHDLLDMNTENEFGGIMQFLTMWGLVGTTAVIGLALILDVIEGPEVLLWLKDVVMAAALPWETIITILYWSIIAINPRLLVRSGKNGDAAHEGQVSIEELAAAMPFSIDACMHAFPGVFLLVDFLLFSRRLPKSIPIGTVVAAVAISYALWVELCGKMNGHFPYPLFDMMSAPQRAAFYGAISVWVCSTGLVVVRLQARLRRSRDMAESSTVSSKKTN